MWGQSLRYFSFAPRHLSGFLQDGFAYLAPYWLGRTQPTVRLTYPPVSPLPQAATRWYRNLNRLSFAYAFWPQLRSRLTLGGRAFPRKPWVFGEGDSHPFYRYLCRHSHFLKVHKPSRVLLLPFRNAPLPFRQNLKIFNFPQNYLAFSPWGSFDPWPLAPGDHLAKNFD